jgi:hypothetical protein
MTTEKNESIAITEDEYKEAFGTTKGYWKLLPRAGSVHYPLFVPTSFLKPGVLPLEWMLDVGHRFALPINEISLRALEEQAETFMLDSGGELEITPYIEGQGRPYIVITCTKLPTGSALPAEAPNLDPTAPRGDLIRRMEWVLDTGIDWPDPATRRAAPTEAPKPLASRTVTVESKKPAKVIFPFRHMREGESFWCPADHDTGVRVAASGATKKFGARFTVARNQPHHRFGPGLRIWRIA